MKTAIYFFSLSVAFLFSCKKDDKDDPSNTTNPAPVACIEVDTTGTNDIGHVFTFTSCSQNATHFEWDFGDGSFATIANPTHVYSASGDYTVRLTAYNAAGISDIALVEIKLGNWYYALDTIVLRKLSNSFSLPTDIYFHNGTSEIDTTVLSLSELPLAIPVGGNPDWQFQGLVEYFYLEADSISSDDEYFFIYSNDIVNDTANTDVLIGAGFASLHLHYSMMHQ